TWGFFRSNFPLAMVASLLYCQSKDTRFARSSLIASSGAAPSGAGDSPRTSGATATHPSGIFHSGSMQNP
ncbi:MAG TPA: hypothetical protein PKV38_16640, partial [bacterium]|nr:hypothetical protein [bacterium]